MTDARHTILAGRCWTDPCPDALEVSAETDAETGRAHVVVSGAAVWLSVETARKELVPWILHCADVALRHNTELARAAAASEPEPPVREPCHEGFHWIGQHLRHCDKCGLPAWEHAGRAALPPDARLFDLGDDRWVLQPWKPGEAEAIRRRWEGTGD